jgi:hypothetical protein
MSDVKAKIASIRAGVDRLREQVPAIEWQAAGVLRCLAELTDVVGQLAAAAGGDASQATLAARAPEDRAKTLERYLYQAARAIAPGLDGPRRDAEIRRILRAWNVTERELEALGYTRA